ncbi:MAG: hypothetical protein JXB10_08200 [Pirellulales bacterium]|nr:hypothetical protein [Pirellulales bacterium]
MTDSTQELLLGHLLGALEDEEQAEVERRLENDPESRRELTRLSRQVVSLAALRRAEPPPPGLAERTCRFVFEHAARPAATEPPKPLPAAVAPPVGKHRFTRLDMVMAATVAVTAGFLIFPALQNGRFLAQKTACQENLHELGKALTQYSQLNGGYFPRINPRGRLAAAGIYAPVLLQNQLLHDVSQVVCPGSQLAAQRSSFHVPTYRELELSPPVTLARFRPTMGGSYGYNLGYVHNGAYQPTKNLYRPNYAILADAPNLDASGRQSLNHGGRGQNVLFEDGHVRFLSTTKTPATGDDIFANDAGQVAAGLSPDDAVLGASGAAPMVSAGR